MKKALSDILLGPSILSFPSSPLLQGSSGTGVTPAEEKRSALFDGYGYANLTEGTRCAYRNRNDPDNKNNNLGFRVVFSPGSP
jgi:formylglycine-generating enzyme required for sulfatase activity